MSFPLFRPVDEAHMLDSCLSTTSGDNLRTYIVAGKHGVCPWILRGKNAGVGSHSLLQGIFPTRNWTWVSCTAGGLFIIRATREALLSQHRSCCIITVFPRLLNWGQEACLVSCPQCQVNHPAMWQVLSKLSSNEQMNPGEKGAGSLKFKTDTTILPSFKKCLCLWKQLELSTQQRPSSLLGEGQ